MTADLRVFKWPLRVVDDQEIVMPLGARVLSVQIQNGQPVLWALVDASPDATRIRVKISIVGTGHPVRFDADTPRTVYVGTFQMDGGALVWHVFARTSPHP